MGSGRGRGGKDKGGGIFLCFREIKAWGRLLDASEYWFFFFFFWPGRPWLQTSWQGWRLAGQSPVRFQPLGWDAP